MHFVEKYQNPIAARNNPRQLFSIFIVSALVLSFLIVTLQKIGTPVSYLIYLAVGLLILIYPTIGFLARTMKNEDFHFIGGRGHSIFNGMAIAAGAFSGSLFILMPGDFYNYGSSNAFLLSGTLLGLALSSLLFSRTVCQNSAYTLPQCLVIPQKQNFSGHLVRLVLIIMVVTCCGLFALAQINLAKQLSSAYLGISPIVVVVLILSAILICLMFGGLRGLTWSRVGFLTLTAAAFLLPIIWMSFDRTSIPIPQLAYGTGALELLGSFEQELAQQGFDDSAPLVSVTSNRLQFALKEMIISTLVVAGGIAAMPHLLQHYATHSSPQVARTSGNWALCICAILLSAAPAYAAFVKLELFNLIVGLPIEDLDDLVPWFFEREAFGTTPLVKICGADALSISAAINACGQTQPYVMAPADFELHSSLTMMEMPSIADLPATFMVLIAIGAFAAILSTTDGAILAAANILSKDLICTLVRPRTPQNTALFVSRVFLILVTLAIGYGSINYELPFQLLFAASLALIAACLFPPMLLRSFFPNCNNWALLGAMVLGIAGISINAWSNHFGPDLLLNTGDEIRWFTSDKTGYISLLFSGGFGAILAITFGAILAIALPKPKAI